MQIQYYFPFFFGSSLEKGWKIVLLLFLHLSVFAQEKTKEFEPIEIVKFYKKSSNNIRFDRDEMERFSPHDLGHLLQYANGITLRDYGGLGGMKTISMRGLGGQHTQFITNGLPVRNAQSGQTDFGLVQIDNFESLEIQQGVSNQLLPVAALAHGNSIVLNTFEHTFSHQKISIRSVNTAGSFGQLENYTGVKLAGDNNFLAISGKYRKVDGDYPYQFKMGNAVYEGVRRNNSLKEYFLTLGGGLQKNGVGEIGKHRFTFNAQIDGSDKELPGAVILYNDLADQSLLSQRLRGGGDYNFYSENIRLMGFVSYNRSDLYYHDPSFLNQQGYLENQYINNGLNTGITTQLDLGQFSFLMGTDWATDQLESNRDLGMPKRISANNLLGVQYRNEYFDATVHGFSQFYVDQNRTQYYTDKIHRLNPQISIASGEKFSKQFVFQAWYKKTLRPPSFNELYYSQIGNLSLSPEDAHQVNVGMVWNKSWKVFNLGTNINAYYNLIDNKILALPTKNLFVWSITNIGKVLVRGMDLQLNSSYIINQNWRFDAVMNLTYQQVQDISNTESPTYRHQIAYTPKFSGNVNGTVSFKNWSLHNTLFFQGERYSLNQNINSNRMDPFAIWDTSLEYKLDFKDKHTLRFQAGIRNVADNHYNFIRYFAMPGRNYFIKIYYEL